jgi:hypothetical protein
MLCVPAAAAPTSTSTSARPTPDFLVMPSATAPADLASATPAPPPTLTSAMASITAAAAVAAAPAIPLTRGGAATTSCAGCSDYDRRDGFTCAQQAAWGCDRSWMQGFCDKTCGRCGCGCLCNDASPRADANCRQLADWGFCPLDENPWMAGACEVTCGRCAVALGDDGARAASPPAAPTSTTASPAPGDESHARCAPPAPSSGANVCERRCYNTVDVSRASPSVLAGRARAAAGAQASASTPDEFVTVSKSGALTLHGAPWVFSGTNFYSALYPWWTQEQVKEALVAHAARGASVIRVFAFTNGENNTGFDMTLQTQPIQPSIGVFSEAALRRLDRLIADAGSTGLKLILALSNVWDEGGGAQWYVDNVDNAVLRPGPPSTSSSTTTPKSTRRPRELFFYDRRIIAAFKAYVRVIVTRTNTITGLPYAHDPAIMAWELCNEPQTVSYYESERGMVPGAALTAWAAEISGLIKSLDPHHLVCMGDEGWRADGGDGSKPGPPFPATGLTPAPPRSLPGYSWMNDGAKGVDAVALAALPTIDFLTVHVYAPNWGLGASSYLDLFTPFLSDRAAIARVARKPIILEEFGAPFGYVPDRDAFIASYAAAAAALGYSGALIWQVFPWRTRSSAGAGFDFDYDKAGGAGVSAMYESFNARARLERGEFWK